MTLPNRAFALTALVLILFGSGPASAAVMSGQSGFLANALQTKTLATDEGAGRVILVKKKRYKRRRHHRRWRRRPSFQFYIGPSYYGRRSRFGSNGYYGRYNYSRYGYGNQRYYRCDRWASRCAYRRGWRSRSWHRCMRRHRC